MAKETTDIPGDFPLPDPVELMRNFGRVFSATARIASLMAERRDGVDGDIEAQVTPADQIAKTLGGVMKTYLGDPNRLADAQFRLWQGHVQLWQNAWRRLGGETVAAVARPEPNDRRFRDPDWEKNPIFDFLKQAYLITSQWALDLVGKADGIDDHTRRKARFYVEQIVNAMSPTNFLFTNPEVLRLTLASNGRNLVDGLERLERDLAAGGGRLRIAQTDAAAFELGRNVATTPGR